MNDAYNVNALRVYTSTIHNLVNDTFPNINSNDLTRSLEELNITALIADLENNVIYNDTSFTTIDVTNELFQDNAYSSMNSDKLKVSFPIEKNNTVVGFIIYEIPKAELVTTGYTPYYISFIVELLLLVLSISLLVHSYNKNIVNTFKLLNKGLLDVSNGIYKTIESDNGFSVRNFTSYNIMLEKIENQLNNQATYAKSRKQLIANISHEIRTPLSYVKISAEILAKDHNISEENKKYVDTILSKITTIDNIIEDLFRYSKQDLDKLLIEPKEVYIKDVFTDVFSNIQLKDESKDINVTASSNIPNVLFKLDKSRIEQVITNMIDNAEKHIEAKGSIDVKAEIDENNLIIIVEDNGEGIKPKDLPYIFEPFYQGEQDDTIKRKGAGLGLAICDYIVRKHNGEIFVYSDEGKGAKFVIKLGEIK